MRVTTILPVLSFLLLSFQPTPGQTPAAAQPKLRAEILATSERGPNFTLTNLSTKTLIAPQIRFFSSSKAARATEMAWDPTLQGVPSGRAQIPGPLEPGATMTMYLPHIVGAPLPDTVEVIAAIWADGETFGQLDKLKLLLQNRSSSIASYEQANAFLQLGLQENRTCDQYLKELPSQNSVAFLSIARTLRTNNGPDLDSRSPRLAMLSLLEHLKQNLNQLREAKP